MTVLLTLSTPPLDRELEITGPVAARLRVISSTADADMNVNFGMIPLEFLGPLKAAVEYAAAIGKLNFPLSPPR